MFDEIDSYSHQFPLRTISTLSAVDITTRDDPVVYSMPEMPSHSTAKRTVSRMARDESDNYSTTCGDDFVIDIDSPVVYETHQASVAITTEPKESLAKRARISCKRASSVAPAQLPMGVPKDLPKLHLGETGRCKLKSMISNLIKDDEELRSQVLIISKIKLASISQLLQMAYVCNIWDEVVRIAQNSTASA